MRNELKNIELIEMYLADKLSTEEKAAFEAQLVLNSELKEEVNFQKEIQERIAVNAFKANLLSYDVEPQAGAKGKGFNFLSIALLLLVAFGSLFFLLKKNTKEVVSDLEQSSKIVASEILTFIEDTSNSNKTEENLFEQDTFKTNSSKKKVNKRRFKKQFKMPKQLQVPFKTAWIDNQKGDTVIMETSGSKIYFAPNAILTKNGEIVNGEVEIRYREYRKVSDMVFSEIPMVFKENGEELLFNSAGMFEIRAYKDKKVLTLDSEKPFVIDYNVVERLDDLNFYSLDDNSQEWSFLNRIELSMAELPEEILTIDTCVVINKTSSYKGGFEAYNQDVNQHPLYLAAVEHGLKGTSYFTLEIDKNGAVEQVLIVEKANLSLMDSITTLIYKDLTNFSIAKMANENVKMPLSLSLKFSINNHKDYLKSITNNSRKKERKISKKDGLSLEDEMITLRKEVVDYIRADSIPLKLLFSDSKKYEIEIDDILYSKVVKNEQKYQTGDTICLNNRDKENYVYEQSKNLYPNLVTGLYANNFGIFNCDQVRRIVNPIQVSGTYVNENEETLEPAFVALVDFKLRAAFPVSTKQFICSSTSNKALFMVAENGKIYALGKNEFKIYDMANGGNFKFVLKEISRTIDKPSDLMKHLKI